MGKRITYISVLVVIIIFHGGNYILTQSQLKEQSQDNDIVLEVDKHFKIVDKGNSIYEYIIYDNESQVVTQDDHFGVIPIITYIEPDIIQILLPAGSNVYYCTYYDIINDKISDQYTSPITTKYGKIAYFDYSKEPYMLIVSDLFSNNSFFREYGLDISSVVSPIIDAYFINERSLYIKYMSGEMQEEKSIVLSLE